MTETRSNGPEAGGAVSAARALEVLLATRSFSRAAKRLPGLDEEGLVALLRTLLPAPPPANPAPAAGSEGTEPPAGKMTAGGDAVLYSDGASRGNPGPAGAGFVLCDRDGNPIREGCRFLGEKTNNEAEYEALLAGLELAAAAGCRRLEVRADSQLVIRQLNGRYRVKNRRLIPLVLRVKQLAARFEQVTFTHVPREENQLADRLANRAIDEAAS